MEMGDEMQIVVAESTSALRSRIEEFILERYEAVYGARVPGFAPRLVALLEGQRILCAAGLRFSHDVLFTEHYLDEPAEMAIARRVGRSVCRSSVFEVSSLCGTSPSGSIALIRAIARSGFDLGY